MRERVEATIEESGYVPNMLGPSLHFQQTMGDHRYHQQLRERQRHPRHVIL
ncbi:MAG: hypothetical protein JXJ17_18735 [Anaerolineae bacterium]|nr:hypothetical protein [Anaerolineae bacterium]